MIVSGIRDGRRELRYDLTGAFRRADPVRAAQV